MKKYLAIAVTTCLFIVSCSKADITSEKNISGFSQTSPNKVSVPQSRCFTITNTEPVYGIIAYRLKYTDCNGVFHNVSLLMGQSVTVCIADGTFDANFSHIVLKAKKC